MNTRHDPIAGRLFYDPHSDLHSAVAQSAVDRDPGLVATATQPQSSDEIHRALFSAR